MLLVDPALLVDGPVLLVRDGGTQVSLTGAFTDAILPILAVTVVGYVVGRQTDVRVGSINTLGLYVLVPALAFHSIVTTDLGGETVLKLAVGVVGYALVMMALAWGVGRLVGASGPLLGALMLAAAFPNSGFVGIPLSEFAFGATGRTTAVLYLTVQNLVVYTLGVYVASRGSTARATGAVREIFRLPLLYAVFAGVVVRAFGPFDASSGPFLDTVGLVGDAAIPVMLLVLGIQLADTDVSAVTRSVTPSVLKLVAAPVVGVAVATALGFSDPTVARVFVLESAAPAAVVPLALTIEYADDVATDDISAPEYLSTAIFTTTVASVAVLTALVALLRAGALL